MTAVEPVFNFLLDGTDKYIDLAQCASAINRRLERQGQQWVVQSVELDTADAGSVEIIRMPNTWPVVNAWVKAYTHWQKQQWETAEDTGQTSREATWRDFKIFLSPSHATAGTAANLLPLNTNFATDPEIMYAWDASEVAVPNDGGVAGATNDYALHMIGASGTTKGLVHEYANSRSRPHTSDPNIVEVPMGGLYGQMEDVGMDTTEIMLNFTERGKNPPYMLGSNEDSVTDGEEYYWGGANNGSTISECKLYGTTGGGNIRTTAGGFIANCGLLYIKNTDINDGVLKIRMAIDNSGYVTRRMEAGN